jgi:hypothetical protein
MTTDSARAALGRAIGRMDYLASVLSHAEHGTEPRHDRRRSSRNHARVLTGVFIVADYSEG